MAAKSIVNEAIKQFLGQVGAGRFEVDLLAVDEKTDTAVLSMAAESAPVLWFWLSVAVQLADSCAERVDGRWQSRRQSAAHPRAGRVAVPVLAGLRQPAVLRRPAPRPPGALAHAIANTNSNNIDSNSNANSDRE